MEEEEFKLQPSISVSDKEFRNKVGSEIWEKIKSKTFRDDGYKCQGCGFEPYDIEPDKVLDAHLVEEDENNPEDSKFRTTCTFCHMIEHADVAITKGYVELVNSHHKQGELVNICRNDSLSSHISNGDIRYLKKTLPEFLEELKSGSVKEGKVKLVFTEKFFSDLKI